MTKLAERAADAVARAEAANMAAARAVGAIVGLSFHARMRAADAAITTSRFAQDARNWATYTAQHEEWCDLEAASWGAGYAEDAARGAVKWSRITVELAETEG